MINSQIRNSKIMVFGSGPVVLFVHGFPEGWFGWRKQIPVFAGAGFRTIAPDMRGYGDSSAPEGVNNYTYLHIVGDLIGLLDALGVEKLPGEAEARIDQVTYDGFFRHVFSDKFATLLPDWSKAFEEKGPLPEWTSEEDLAYFISEFRKHGLTPAINYYRALDLSWELTAAWTNHKVMVPTIFMIGDHDLVYHFPNAKQDIERMAERVPLLKKITVVEGANHFLQLERADIVNDHILQFFKSF
ncbi:hypothetical protein KP509_38G056900 [Ceratopteris richardii]|uniref:AB hydrolase-1 domain-containing protein n=1 Tax=Ceratopteris richardii TaxID=49495 RepID=A0A8T2Q532_CERRI|nr:hypothetical protein KP509_38G056900 [Ceratopteris richardii]